MLATTFGVAEASEAAVSRPIRTSMRTARQISVSGKRDFLHDRVLSLGNYVI